MRPKKFRYFVGDFETTVYKGQDRTDVWASACVEMYTEDVKVFHSIDEQFKYFESLNCNIICYYHNLKFDGSFWLSYLLLVKHFTQAYTIKGDDITSIKWIKPREIPNDSFSYSISDMGLWYSFTIKVNNKTIELRDSLKLLPFTLKRIGKAFKTKHQKLDMEYTGFRYPGCEITAEEEEYIKNDVLVIKEALEIMFNEGHKKLTIGSCCLAEYRNIIGSKLYKELFPDLYAIPLDKEAYGCENAGEYIRKSYRGGWCYVVRGKEKKRKSRGVTADVNSLYPSMMHSESNNFYPVGKPTFWKGNIIPDEAFKNNRYFFVRLRTRFYLKENMLPFIQVKNSLLYPVNSMLETSDVSFKDGVYSEYVLDFDGELVPTTVIMTVTMTDFKLMLEHYGLVDLEILDGCYFDTRIGLFDEYIDKWKAVKVTSKGAKRELAKLFLNNLYGKFASSTDSSFKVAYVKEDKSIGYITVTAHDKKPGYIAVGSAVTSYARNFTIRAAQANYYGKDERGFIYADTDSIHCDLEPEELKDIRVHPTDFCCWKLEAQWDEAIFTRQKTYIEHVIVEDGEEIEDPYYNVKCAGMPEKCKNLFIKSLTGYTPSSEDDFTEEEVEFINKKRELEDFDIGLTVPGKLMPKRIEGGVLLVETTYKMR